MDEHDLPEEIDEAEEDLIFDDDELLDEEMMMVTFDNNMDRFMAVASVDAVFGEPVEKGDTLIIPAAEVGSAMGFGLGSGTGEQGTNMKGNGGGGGGWNFSRPVAVIVASPEGVRVEPVLDVTKVAIAAFTTAGFMLGLVLRMLRGPSRH